MTDRRLDHSPGAQDLAPDAAPRHARRRFIAWLSGIGAALTGTIAGVPAALGFASPALRKRPAEGWRKVVDDVNTLDGGIPNKVDFVEALSDAWVTTRTLRSVWLYTEDGEKFTAFSGVCPHLGCSYGFDAAKERFHCPCHHGIFDMKTGAVLAGPPPRGLDTLPVKVENGEVHIIYESFRAGIPEKVQI
ncbi:MAG: Rieske 2Fe-2S domain-containing protein [Gemmatimonadota bacterium]|nr:Rieske 2Fe-2S domain-containing protein [Gemmatimonadota bacterium]